MGYRQYSLVDTSIYQSPLKKTGTASWVGSPARAGETARRCMPLSVLQIPCLVGASRRAGPLPCRGIGRARWLDRLLDGGVGVSWEEEDSSGTSGQRT